MKKGEGSRDCIAPSDTPTDWESIDWIRVKRVVKGRQKRIANAAQEGDWRRVKSLQRWLTISFCAKALAIKEAVRHLPKHADGIDRRTWANSQRKFAAIAQLTEMRPRPLLLEGHSIPESLEELHSAGLQSMLKKAMQNLHFMALDPVLEAMCGASPQPSAQTAGVVPVVVVDASNLA